jgi:hypothetical protein
MKIQTFVFAHTEQIILDFEINKKFSDIPNLYYVLVGHGSCERIRQMSNVIIARELKHNLEDCPKLAAYSGWHALWKNNLIDADFVNFFEYDIILDKNFQQIQKGLINEDTQYISYIPLEVHDYWFVQCDDYCLPLLNSMQKHYNINCKNYVAGIKDRHFVGVTSNQSMSYETLSKFMEWMKPIEEDIKYHWMSGHMPERAFPFFCMYYNLHGYLINNVVRHFSFGTTNNGAKEYFDSNYKTLITK